MIRVFKVSSDGKTVAEGKRFATCDVGAVRRLPRRYERPYLDLDRRWCVHCYHPDGTLLGKTRCPEIVGNVTFGAPKRNRLYIMGQTSLYSPST